MFTKALLTSLLLAPLSLATTLTAETPILPTSTISIPTITLTSTLRLTATITTTSYLPGITSPSSSSTSTRCLTAEYRCPGCETTEFVTFSTPCSIPAGKSCPTATFPPLTKKCQGCPTYSCIMPQPKTHWIQTCTYPAGCPEPTKTYRPCPATDRPLYGTGV